MELNVKTYPKSIHNIQCIGPCYYPGTMIVHPVTLQTLTDPDEPFCPVNQFEHFDKNTGMKTTKSLDICYRPTDNVDLSGKEFEMNMLNPNIEFNNNEFLKIYYNISSFEDAINYIDSKKYLPIATKLRIIDCSLNAFGYELTIFDNRVVDFFIDVISQKWMDDIYDKIGKYIKIDGDKISFKNNIKRNVSAFHTDSETDKNIKYNFIKSKFITPEEIYKFLSRYLKHRKENWKQIKQHSINIKKDFIDYIELKISK